MVVADATRAASFEAARRVVAQLREDGGDLGCPPDLPIALALNKCDLDGQRAVARDAVDAFAAEFKLADARDTSCKTGEGVLDLARALVAALPPPPPEEAAAPTRLAMPSGDPCGRREACGGACG